MSVNEDLIEYTQSGKNSNGGTEKMIRAIYARVPRELLEQVQIIPGRVEVELNPEKIRILWVHDLCSDSQLSHLANGGYNRFHAIVFVSHWQMQSFIRTYNIPWSKCYVIQNGIVPIPVAERPDDGVVRLIYTSTPHRGLVILNKVFQRLCETHDNIELDVFSSFGLYGWQEKDEQFKPLFDELDAHPKINNHGAQPNDVVREALTKSHIFAYPSIWEETSCLCLMEAMSAGCLCVHSSYGALFETAANLTVMYQYNENLNNHAGIFYDLLNHSIENINNEALVNKTKSQKIYADHFYNIDLKATQWESLITSLLHLPRHIEGRSVTIDTTSFLPRL